MEQAGRPAAWDGKQDGGSERERANHSVEPSNRKSANNVSENISVGHANKSLQRAEPTY